MQRGTIIDGATVTTAGGAGLLSWQAIIQGGLAGAATVAALVLALVRIWIALIELKEKRRRVRERLDP